jgi:tetratricopeptide (TPR) repeat protein
MISWDAGSDGEGQRAWLSFGMVPLACLLIYGASVGSGVFQYDDLHSIVGNRHLDSLKHVPSYFTDPGAFSSLEFGGMFRPLVLTSYALTKTLVGDSPMGFHLGNVLIHALAGLLVVAVLKRMGVGAPTAVFAGLLFICHPVNTEAAVYVSSRSESLSTVFVLLSLYLWLGGAALGKQDWRLFAGPVAFSLALLSKSVAIVFPAILLLYDIFDRDIFHRDILHRAAPYRQRQWWRSAVWRHGPYWLVACVYLSFVSGALSKALLADPVRSAETQLLTQAKALVFYLRLLVLPRGLSVDHAFTEAGTMADAAVLLSIAVILSCVYLVVRSSKLPSDTLFWLAWLPMVLLPTLIVPLNVLVNEHRLYPVLAGAVVLLSRMLRLVPPSRGFPVAAVLLLSLGTMAYQRAQVWSDPWSLWSDARDKAPGMPRPHLFVGDAYFHAGRHTQALASYAEAEHVNPEYLTPGDRLALHNNRGAALLALGRAEEAIQSYEAALRIEPDFAPASTALQGLRAVAQSSQRSTEADRLSKRGLVALVSGDLVAAAHMLRQSLVLQADGSTSLALGMTLGRQGHWQEAEQVYEGLIASSGTTEATRATAQRRLLEITAEASTP